jgi:hypothetical protein
VLVFVLLPRGRFSLSLVAAVQNTCASVGASPACAGLQRTGATEAGSLFCCRRAAQPKVANHPHASPLTFTTWQLFQHLTPQTLVGWHVQNRPQRCDLVVPPYSLHIATRRRRKLGTEPHAVDANQFAHSPREGR